MLKVIKAGFYTTIQDTGRFGNRAYGVPVSGAMDAYSLGFANMLLGNDKNDAALEMTMVGGIFQFFKPTLITISGANMNPELNNRPIKQNRILKVHPNDILKFDKAKKGFRTYLAIKGGIKSELVLGSRSQYKPITYTNMISIKDELEYFSYNGDFEEANSVVKYDGSILSEYILDVYKGPEFNGLDNHSQKLILTNTLKVSKLNNRMAYQLEPIFPNNLKPILTSPVLPGTVQLTPKGNLMVLMRDGQTTGGYPRVMQLTERAINILAQKKVDDIIKIRLKE